jgi:hypothetical protein
MAGRYDILILQGETFQKKITWKDSSGNEIDLTGYSAKMQIRTAVTGGTIIAELSTDNNKIVITGTLLTLTISATDTALMDFVSPAFFDLEITKDGVTKRLIQGIAKLSLEVTK